MGFRKGKRKKVFTAKNAIGIFVIILMVTSVLGVIGGSGATTRYNGFKIKQDIVQSNQGSVYEYSTKIDGTKYTFANHPENLESIAVDKLAVDVFTTQNPIFVTFNPSDRLVGEIEYARFHMVNTLSVNTDKQFVFGVTNQTAPYDTLPLFTCENATQQTTVVMLQENSEQAIRYVDNCIIVEAPTGFSMVSTYERLVYGLFGVMNNE